MPYLNLNLGLMVFEDPSSRNPNIKLSDISQSIQNVGVDNDKSDRFHLGPNETKDILTTMRSLAWNNTTQLHFNRYISTGDHVRITYTGVGAAPAFRTNRAIGGGATTQVSITRVSPVVARISNVAGTPWTLTSVAVGDVIKIEKDTDVFTSPFSAINKGKSFIVQAKTSSSIDFVDNGEAGLDSTIVLGTDFEFALRVFSPGPVKVGDTVDLSGAGLNPANQGRFSIVDLSYDYIEIVSTYGIDETILYGTNIINVYDYLIGFLHLRASDKIKLRFGPQTEWMQIGRLQADAIFAGSVETYKVQAYNDSSSDVIISVQHARITNC